jgi:hypothetical protein
LRGWGIALAIVTGAVLATANQRPAAGAIANAASGPRFRISFDAGLRREALTGRIFVFVSKRDGPEPRLQYDGPAATIPLFGVDVSLLAPGATATVDAQTPGYPIATPHDLPPGDYTVQALANVYTRFARADGYTIWAHADHGEGQQFAISPGNLVSEPLHVHFDPARPATIALKLTRAIAPLPAPADTPFVKHIRFVSTLLSKFWGAPVFLGAVVLLPKEYDPRSDQRYPAVYVQGHY